VTDRLLVTVCVQSGDVRTWPLPKSTSVQPLLSVRTDWTLAEMD